MFRFMYISEIKILRNQCICNANKTFLNLISTFLYVYHFRYYLFELLQAIEKTPRYHHDVTNYSLKGRRYSFHVLLCLGRR